MKRVIGRESFVSRAAVTAASLLAAMAASAPHAQELSLPDGYVQSPAVEPGLAPGMEITERPSAARVFEVVFSEGDEILSGLTELAETHGITSGHITGLGGLASAELGFGDPSIGEYVFKEITIDEKSELVSLVGNVTMRDGEPTVHLHAVLALEDGTTRGGHLIEARVAPVAEASLVATDVDGDR